MTTLEVSNLGRYGYMGGRGILHNQGRQTGMVGAGMGMSGASEEGAPDEHAGHRHGHGHGHHAHSHSPCKACTAPLMKILGLDRFTKGKAVSGMRRAGMDQNPFDLGVVKVSGLLHVDTDDRIVTNFGRVLSIIRHCTIYPQVVSRRCLPLLMSGWRNRDQNGYQSVSNEVV
jgi:hypothetical protein